MSDQKTDNDQTVSPNMTLKTSSKSPTHGQAEAFRPTGADSDADNNGYHGRITAEDLVRRGN